MSVKDNLKDAVSNVSEVETYQKKIEGFIDVLKRHGNSNAKIYSGHGKMLSQLLRSQRGA